MPWGSVLSYFEQGSSGFTVEFRRNSHEDRCYSVRSDQRYFWYV